MNSSLMLVLNGLSSIMPQIALSLLNLTGWMTILISQVIVEVVLKNCFPVLTSQTIPIRL